MSQLRLLTTGKSLVGLTQSESHYRVIPERLLPKFGPVKNPFVSIDKSEPARQEADKKAAGFSAPSQQTAKLAQLPARNLSGSLGVAGSKLAAFLADAGRPRPKSGLRLRSAAFGTAWAKKLRALFSRPAPRPAQAVLARATSPPVQGELSLERIKVVRNDLSDADLEIVTRKSPTVRTGATPVLQVAQRTAQGGMSWGRFSGIFGTGKR
jgi:hypothetical protein